MLNFAILSLLVFSLILGVAPTLSEKVRAIAVAPLFLVHLLIALYVSAGMSQDRNQYFKWYQRVQLYPVDNSEHDLLFSYLLSFFPAGLSNEAFWVILTTIVFVALVVFFIILVRQRTISIEIMLLSIIILITDRMFLDLILNSSRSGLAMLLFLIGVVISPLYWRLPLWGVSFGVHERVIVVLIALFILAAIIRRYPVVIKALIVISFAVFLVKLVFGVKVFSYLAELSVIIRLYDNESFIRGVTTQDPHTVNITIQIVIGLVIPMTLIILDKSREQKYFSYLSKNLAYENLLFSFSTIVMGFAFLLYPEFALAKRFILIPIICLLIGLRKDYLTILAVFKIAIAAVVLTSYLPKIA